MKQFLGSFKNYKFQNPLNILIDEKLLIFSCLMKSFNGQIISPLIFIFNTFVPNNSHSSKQNLYCVYINV